MKFNLIAFNSKATAWQNRMVEVGEQSLKGAWKWIQGLTCWGSTNTYAALQHALSDPGTQAVYLLTDGRPDQVCTLSSFKEISFESFKYLRSVNMLICAILYSLKYG